MRRLDFISHIVGGDLRFYERISRYGDRCADMQYHSRRERKMSTKLMKLWRNDVSAWNHNPYHFWNIMHGREVQMSRSLMKDVPAVANTPLRNAVIMMSNSIRL